MAKLVKNGTKGAGGKVEIPKTGGPAAEPVAGIAEIDFGVKPSKTTGKKSKYPEIESVQKLVDKVIDLGEKFDAVADPFKAAKQELIETGFPQFFDKNKGKFEAPSSMLAYGTPDKEGKQKGVRVTFKDQFTPGDRQRLMDLLGPERAAAFFQQQWSVKIKGEALAADPAKGKEFIEKLGALAVEFGLDDAVEIKAGILPVAGFAQKRHREFTPDENMKIQGVVPQWASVSTKGVS